MLFRSGAKRCRVAKVSKMHARFRLVIFAKFDDGLDGSRVGVDSMRATNGEQPFPFSRDAWSFHKEFPAINFLASTNNVGSSLVGLKIFATGCGLGMFCVGPVLQPHKKMHAMPMKISMGFIARKTVPPRPLLLAPRECVPGSAAPKSEANNPRRFP